MAPMSTSAASSRLLLLAAGPRHEPGVHGAKIRRYRLARLQLNAERREGFAHLKRSYD